MSERRSVIARTAAGFTLPAVLVIAAALLILAVGILTVSSLERRTARSYVDLQRAELAARAGLEDLKAKLLAETANDDFIILSAPQEPLASSRKQAPPMLYIARGRAGGDAQQPTFRHIPLFSANQDPIPSTTTLRPPTPDSLLKGEPTTTLAALPWNDPATVAWLPLLDASGKMVARYAVWVEDLQSRLDPRIHGNTAAAGTHRTTAFPFPAPGVNDEPLSAEQPRLNQVALHALDPKSGDEPAGDLTAVFKKNRPLLISPDSILAAANVSPPLVRSDDGLLTPGAGQSAALPAIERSTLAVSSPYLELPTIPYAPGIAAASSGEPKLNLNQLLTLERGAAVNQFRDAVSKALPRFDESRRGGFPEDYTATLAASALDYADEDSDPTVKAGEYRGIDSFPFLSEVILHINNLGMTTVAGRHTLRMEFRLFVELWNLTSVPVSGKSRFSYEVDLRPSGIGAIPPGPAFDSPLLLDNPTRSSHSLTKEDGLYWTPEISIQLGPDQYRMLEAAKINYTIDLGPSSMNIGSEVSLSQANGIIEAGITHRWNNVETERIPKIVRDAFEVNFKTTNSYGKAAIPGHSYGPYGTFINNIGDPRASHYLRNTPLGSNSYPRNITPHRRNIRRGTIYDSDSATKPRYFGRVLPSEWPDGGHDSPVGTWPVQSNTKILPTDPSYGTSSAPAGGAAVAPQRISNRGRFFSATELGRVFDPVMWKPTYAADSDTNTLHGAIALLPASKVWMPDVILKSPSSVDFCGGNTLRIGRPEHPRFDLPGLRAAHLLDLFHAGQSTSADATLRESPLAEINGHINVNTADRDTLRAMAVGWLSQDPNLARISKNRAHQTSFLMAIPTTKMKLGSPTTEAAADRVADAILRSRPFSSAAELAAASETPRPAAQGNETDPAAIFGNRKMYPDGDDIRWADAAAEELFARFYEASTFRSRNFRVWVIGQSLAPTSPTNPNPEVLAESRKSTILFADPGERKSDGKIDPAEFNIRTLNENSF
jgi:hypothetical protein